MKKIILQPAADKASERHFKHTVINSIRIADILEFITHNEAERLRENYPSGEFKVWGITPSDGKVKSWSKINRGDTVLFAKSKFIVYSATVTFKSQNNRLAAKLWGFDKEQNTWEYLYFLDELTTQEISYADLNVSIPRIVDKKITHYALNKNVQGFQVLEEWQSESVFNAFDFQSQNYFDDGIAGNFEAALNKLRKLNETNVPRKVMGRREQQTLSEYLFGSKIFDLCGICYQRFPVSFLVTAHIKKRTICSHEERINPYIVMPMCKLGCDELYEQGYIGVKDGKVVGINQSHITPTIEAMKKTVIGNNCSYYRDETKGYFDWHLKENKFQ